MGNKITLKTFKGQSAEGFVAKTLVNRNTPTVSKSLSLQISKSKPTVSLEIRRTESNTSQNVLHEDDVLCVVQKKFKFAHHGVALYVNCHSV